MDRTELKLKAQPQAWRLFSTRKADPAFKKFAEKVLERDRHVCQFCGFQADEYMEVVNKDNDYANTKMDNMITVCPLCMQCLFIESIDFNDYGGGKIIYLPEMSQAELNGLCHVIFCAIANATDYRTNAQTIYRDLKLRIQVVDEILGEGMSNPVKLGQMLIDAPVEDRDRVQETLLKDLRLLPSKTKFDAQIHSWAASALKDLAA
ncbi:MAG: type IVB secretion system protein IcmJDotN [Gammaproteobacteria bacterium]|nr:type IVB secretion system protein IcmJDotN [Gammaproteobacteria bacterium]